MNIALVTPEYVSELSFDGGLANYTHRLAKSLIQMGHKPVVIVRSETNEKIEFEGIDVYRVDIEKYDEWIYSNKYLCKPYTLAKRLLYRRTPWHRLENKYGLKIQSLQLNRRLKELHQQIKFDIVHYSHLAGVGYYRPGKIPAIARLSSSTSLCQQFGGYGAPDNEIIQQEQLEFKTLRKMDGVFGPSRQIAAIIEKEISRKIEIIETPFVEETVPADKSLYETKLAGKKYLLFFGTIGLIKGVGTIAEIIGEFLAQYPDHYFVFVGKVLHSPENGLDMLQYLQKKAGVNANRIIHFGKTPHAQLYPIIEHSQFVVLPSRIDNFPNTCIESMAHSRIVIGTRGNGFEQLIVDGENGFLVPVDDHAALLNTIKKIMALNASEKEAIEANSFKRAQSLRPEIVVNQLIDFYLQTIKKFNS